MAEKKQNINDKLRSLTPKQAAALGQVYNEPMNKAAAASKKRATPTKKPAKKK